MSIRYNKSLKLDLGFPQGVANPKALEKQRNYQKAYRRKYRLRELNNKRRHDTKRRNYIPGVGTAMSRYLFAEANKAKKLQLRKSRMKYASKKMLELQKLYPNLPSRQYLYYIGYTLGTNKAKLSRSNDMPLVPKRRKTPQSRKTKSKHT